MVLQTFGQGDQESQGFRNAVLMELGGHGLFYSVNYDRTWIRKGIINIHSQVGIAYYPPPTDVIDIWFPMMITQNFFKRKHKLEVGAGYSAVRESVRDAENNPVSWEWNGFYTYRIGYRFVNIEKRFLFRIAYTPLIEKDNYSSETHPLGGVSFGYLF